MPIPLYVPPMVRPSHDPSPFGRTVSRQRLRILVDQPLMSGSVDGVGEFQGYPTTGGGSTGYPEVAAVLRSYLGHPSLEVLFVADELDREGAVVFGESDPVRDGDVLPFEVWRSDGVRTTGVNYYQEAVTEASEVAARHQLDEPDARAGVLLCRAGMELEADAVVTARGWLLAERLRSRGRHLASVASPEEALALMGLYLRWHYQPVVLGGALLPWRPESMRHSAAFVAMPGFERWNQAGRTWYAADGDLTLELLNQSCLTRVSRAFKFRDSVFALSATMAGYEPEEMLCELDSLLFSLVGAFDVAACIVDRLLGMRTNVRYIGWQKDWQAKLETRAPTLYKYTADGREMQQMFKVLRWLRNTVHNEALNVMQEDRAWVVTVPVGTQTGLRNFLRERHSGWTAEELGLRAQSAPGAVEQRWLPGTGHRSFAVRRPGAPGSADPLAGQLVLDVRRFINKLFPAVLTDLNGIMQLTPLNQVPGYTAVLEQPSRVNLPWQFSDTTGHRLRMIYGITELA